MYYTTSPIVLKIGYVILNILRFFYGKNRESEVHSIKKLEKIQLFFSCFFQLNNFIIFSRYYIFENRNIYIFTKIDQSIHEKILFSNFISNPHNSYKKLN